MRGDPRLHSRTLGILAVYTSLGVDRLAWDTLQRMWDPDASGAFSRIEQRARKESGTQYWWRPDQTEPMRPPNIEAALGR